MRNCPAVMAAVHDSVAAHPRAAAIDLGILVEKCIKESQVRSRARYRWLSEDDLEPWAIGSGDSRRSQCQRQRLTLAMRQWLTLSVRDELRRPTAENQPQPRRDAGFQPGECGDHSLELGSRAAANTEIRSVNTECQAERSCRRMQRVMSNQVRRNTPDAIGSVAIQGDHKARSPQETRCDENSPVFQRTRVRGFQLPQRAVNGGQCHNRLVVRIPQDGWLKDRPALRRVSRLSASTRDLVTRQRAKRVCADFGTEAKLLPDLGLR